MHHNKILDLIGTVLLFIGFFLAFLPHAIHSAVGLSDETSHLRHVISGMVIVIIALVILVKNKAKINK